MIIQEQQKDLEIVGEDTSRRATISAEEMSKLQYLLTKGLYKDPINAVIAEWTNNGVDSVVQSGKNPIENPVLVKINKDNRGQYTLSVEDKGVGLDDRDFKDVCMNYLKSTKEDSNQYIGSFGLGMKSFLALERSATFTCRKDGKERVYLVYEGAEFVNYDLITEKDTTEENGVKAELVIRDGSERNSFVIKAKQKLAYYDTAVLLIDNQPVENVINRSELFQWSSLNSNVIMHLCLKDVYYSIDWEALGIYSIGMPIALRFGLDDGIIPTPSRESYITNEKTKQLIIDRIKKVADWFVEKYNTSVKEFDSFLSAYPHLGTDSYKLEVGGKEFIINPLVEYSSIIPAEPKVKGITLRTANTYKRIDNHMFMEYEVVGFYSSYSGFKTKKTGKTIRGHLIYEEEIPILVGTDFVGNVKEYLKEEYGTGTLFIRRSSFIRELGTYKKNQAYESYRSILNLNWKSRSEWRDVIKEWHYVEGSMTSLFKDETKVASTPEFIEWLEEKRRKQREKRGSPDSNYTGLNKKLGDVTLAYSYVTRLGLSFGKKKAFPIIDLPKNKFLTVTITDEDVELVKKIISVMNNEHVKFAKVGKLEAKKLPSIQFVNFQLFIMSKPFMRIASAILFDSLLTKFDEVKGYRDGIFQNCLKSYVEAAKQLRLYVDENSKDTGDEEVTEAIIRIAEEKDLFDKQLWEVYLYLQEGIKKYDWVTCLKEPSVWDSEEVKKYNRLITQILLFRKKYYNDLPENAEIVFIDKVEKEDEEEGEFDEMEETENDFSEEELITV